MKYYVMFILADEINPDNGYPKMFEEWIEAENRLQAELEILEKYKNNHVQFINGGY